MKRLFILVLISLYGLSLFANCGFQGIWVFPKGNKISKNSIFIIEGYARSKKVINNLDGKYPAYLQSKNHVVKLKVEAIYESEYRLAQAILKPEETLRVGEEYWLKIDSLNEGMSKFGSYKNQKIKWVVQNKIDNKSPFWYSEMRPKLINKTYHAYGCGPAIFAHFQVKINDASETLVKTEVMDLTNNKSTIYYLSSKDGEVAVGHGMCSGAFALKKNGKYKVRFDLLDASGNSYGRWSEWRKFNNFQTEMGMFNFSKSNNLPLHVGALLFFITIFIKRHSDKV